MHEPFVAVDASQQKGSAPSVHNAQDWLILYSAESARGNARCLLQWCAVYKPLGAPALGNGLSLMPPKFTPPLVAARPRLPITPVSPAASPWPRTVHLVLCYNVLPGSMPRSRSTGRMPHRTLCTAKGRVSTYTAREQRSTQERGRSGHFSCTEFNAHPFTCVAPHFSMGGGGVFRMFV